MKLSSVYWDSFSFKVVHPYNPSESDELELRAGDYVYISSEAIANSPDGWVEGISWLTGVSGLFPENYTQRTAESDAWTLHKKIPLNQLTTSEAKSSPKKEYKPSTSETDVYRVTSTTDETKFIDEDDQKEDKEPTVNKRLYENVLELKEQVSESEVSHKCVLMKDWNKFFYLLVEDLTILDREI